MIVAMKKIAIIMQQKDAKEGIEALRSLGVVHVEHQQAPEGKDINLLQDDLSLASHALEIFLEEEFAKEPKGKDIDRAFSDWRFTARHIIDLSKRLDHLKTYYSQLIQQINDWRAWGDFEPQSIRRLAEKNIYLGLYKIPQKDLPKLPKDLVIEKISIKAGMAYCAVVSRERIDLGLKELELPRFSLDSMQKRLQEDKKVIEQIRQELNKCLCYQRGLKEVKKSLQKDIEFQQALNGMAQISTLVYLMGYAPKDKEAQLLSLAAKEEWGTFITEPLPEDNVPTLIRNPRWASLINPVFKLMEVVPGYRELDVSPIFLLFLALFFGMIIGDAGYGAIYFALTFLAQRKYGAKVKEKNVFFLFYLFSFCAIIWGLLTGTLFGQQWYLARGFKALAPALNNAKFLMAFCFLLGAFQLSLAHGWQALRKLPSLTALADIGFICLLWVGFLLAKMFILGDAFPAIGPWLAWTGIILIILFVSPRKNFLKTIGAGLGTLALGLVGNFGDVVSYIRLFAIGLAGVAVADSVNALAAVASGNIIAQTLILFLGHSINIMLGPISVLVHGIRLNVLEFSLLHANVTWSGLAYKPLKE